MAAHPKGGGFFTKGLYWGGWLFDERAILGREGDERAILEGLFDERAILMGWGFLTKELCLRGFLTKELYWVGAF